MFGILSFQIFIWLSSSPPTHHCSNVTFSMRLTATILIPSHLLPLSYPMTSFAQHLLLFNRGRIFLLIVSLFVSLPFPLLWESNLTRCYGLNICMPPIFISWNLIQHSDIRRCGLKVIRSWKLCLREWDLGPCREVLRVSTIWGHIASAINEKHVLIWHQVCWYLGLGFSSLQNGKQYIFVVYKLSNLRHFVTVAWMNSDTRAGVLICIIHWCLNICKWPNTLGA